MNVKKVSRFTVCVLIFSLVFGMLIPQRSQAATDSSKIIQAAPSIKSGETVEGNFDKPETHWLQITPTKDDTNQFSHVEFDVESDDYLNISVYPTLEKAEKDETYDNYRATSGPEEKAVIDFPFGWEGSYYVKIEYFGEVDEEGLSLPEAENKTAYKIHAQSVKLPPSATSDELGMDSCPVELSAVGKSTGKNLLSEIRKFRDGVLSKSEEGRALSSLYYKAAPFLVLDMAGSKSKRDNVYNNLVILQPLIADLNENGESSTAVISNKQQQAIKELFDVTVDAVPASLKKEMNGIADKIGINNLAGERVVDIASKAGYKLPASKSITSKYIVKMKPGKKLTSVQTKVQSYGTFSTFKKQDVILDDTYVVELKGTGKMSATALTQVENLSDVEYIEPVKTYKALSNDIQSPYQWSLNNEGREVSKKGADIHNDELQKLIKNRDLKETLVAVIDTGVDNTLADLKDKVNMGQGKNFIDPKVDAIDDNGHGTHVSGIIAAQSNNGYSMEGINPLAKILPVKVLDSSGAGDTEKIAAGIIYAADKGAKVINLSLGGSYSRTIEYALNYAASKGVVIVAASGNEASMLSYPASSKYVISVGATNAYDIVSDYSNFGPTLDLVAPGTGIPSLMPNGNVTLMDGTSMATPHVAAVAALLLSGNPGLKINDVRTILHETSDYIAFKEEDNEGMDQDYTDEGEPIAPAVDRDYVSGFGRLNGFSALSKVDLKAAVNPILDNQTKLTGTAKAGSKVEVKNGSKTIGTAVTSAKGTFSVAIPAQKADQRLNVVISDSSKVAVSSIKLFVKKGETPKAPTVKAVSDKDTFVTGKATAGIAISIKNSDKKIIGKGNADSKGNYKVKISKQKAGTKLSITATDAAKRESKAAKVTVLDKTAPSAPKVDKVTDKSKKITGKAEAGSTVTVKYKDKKIGSAKADKKGKFTVKISKKKAGSTLSVTAKDKAGNTGKATKVTVKKYKK